MIRGSTPTHIFHLPIPTEVVKGCLVSYGQKNRTILRKRTNECELSENKIIVHLSQTDTLRIDDAIPSVDVQIKIALYTGEVIVSRKIRIGLTECLDDEEVEI